MFLVKYIVLLILEGIRKFRWLMSVIPWIPSIKKETTFVSDDRRSSANTGRWSGSPDCWKNQGDERRYLSNRVTWSGEAPADADGERQWLSGSPRPHPCPGVQTQWPGTRQTPVNKPWCVCVFVSVNQCVISVYKVLCKVRSTCSKFTAVFQSSKWLWC